MLTQITNPYVLFPCLLAASFSFFLIEESRASSSQETRPQTFACPKASDIKLEKLKEKGERGGLNGYYLISPKELGIEAGVKTSNPEMTWGQYSYFLIDLEKEDYTLTDINFETAEVRDIADRGRVLYSRIACRYKLKFTGLTFVDGKDTLSLDLEPQNMTFNKCKLLENKTFSCEVSKAYFKPK